MKLYFSKMHALGNDFVVLDAVSKSITMTKDLIIKLANRHRGIGFDQCLIIEPSKTPEVDFFYRIYNADGEEVGQCGNGARCLALFAFENRLTDKRKIAVATKTTRMLLEINRDNSVTVDFGKPLFEPKSIPLLSDKEAVNYKLPLKNGGSEVIYALSVGNPHAVILVDSVEKAEVASRGQEISEHPFFPEQTNTGFFEIRDSSTIGLRVYERGCGETEACGSGAVAAAAIARLFHNLAAKIKVQLPGGELLVEWSNPKSNIFLTGPACFVYEGQFNI